MTERIVWEPVDNGYGVSGYRGYLPLPVSGRMHVASTSWSVKRNDPKPYVLRTELPGWKLARHFETEADARQAVERILLSFIRAVLGDEPTVIVVDDPTTVRETLNAPPNGVRIVPTEIG